MRRRLDDLESCSLETLPYSGLLDDFLSSEGWSSDVSRKKTIETMNVYVNDDLQNNISYSAL